MRERCINVHASCVRLAGAGRPFGAPRDAGVLLLGKSGAGKSDLVLRLIAAGAVLVADDRVDLWVRKGKLLAGAPANISGLLEIRGLGIVELPRAKDVRVALAIKLARSVERLPTAASFAPRGLGLAASARPPLIELVAFDASAPAKIGAAAAAFGRGLLREFVKPQ